MRPDRGAQPPLALIRCIGRIGYPVHFDQVWCYNKEGPESDSEALSQCVRRCGRISVSVGGDGDVVQRRRGARMRSRPHSRVRARLSRCKHALAPILYHAHHARQSHLACTRMASQLCSYSREGLASLQALADGVRRLEAQRALLASATAELSSRSPGADASRRSQHHHGVARHVSGGRGRRRSPSSAGAGGKVAGGEDGAAESVSSDPGDLLVGASCLPPAAAVLLKPPLLAQDLRRAGLRSSDSEGGSRSRPERVGGSNGGGREGRPGKGAPDATEDRVPLALAQSPAGDAAGLDGQGSEAAGGGLDLEAVDAKLVGMDKKLERIAVAVGARIFSGVRKSLSVSLL